MYLFKEHYKVKITVNWKFWFLNKLHNTLHKEIQVWWYFYWLRSFSIARIHFSQALFKSCTLEHLHTLLCSSINRIYSSFERMVLSAWNGPVLTGTEYFWLLILLFFVHMSTLTSSCVPPGESRYAPLNTCITASLCKHMASLKPRKQLWKCPFKMDKTTPKEKKTKTEDQEETLATDESSFLLLLQLHRKKLAAVQLTLQNQHRAFPVRCQLPWR